MPTPVTVVIVNWNGGETLRRCLEALARQTMAPAETIVFDNASGAPPIALCAEMNVRLVRSPANLGFAAGNNRAIALCATPLVALLNPDAFPEPQWLERLIASAEANPGVAAFGSRQLMDGRAGVLDGTGDVCHLSGLPWRLAHGMQQRPEDLVAGEIFSPCAAAALYRREALLEIGGFDESFFCYVEDVDLGFRLRLRGHRCLYVPDAVVSHMGSASAGTAGADFALYHGHRNLTWNFVKNMPAPLFWPLLPAHLLLCLVELAVFSARGRGAIWRAKRDALRGLPRIWQARRTIQAQRTASVASIWRALDKWPFTRRATRR